MWLFEMTNFVFCILFEMTSLYFGLCFFVNGVFSFFFFLLNSQASQCQFRQTQVVPLCECACVCVCPREKVLAEMGVASGGTACCCVKKIGFFNCAGNPRLKPGGAVAKVRCSGDPL